MDENTHKEVTQSMIDVMQAWLDGRKIQFAAKTGDARDLLWHDSEGCPRWDWTGSHYRIKPKPDPDSVNWMHVQKDFNYLARDKSGIVYLFEEKPQFDGRCWTAMSGICVNASGLASYNHNGADAGDSMSSRIIMEGPRVTFRVDSVEIST